MEQQWAELVPEIEKIQVDVPPRTPMFDGPLPNQVSAAAAAEAAATLSSGSTAAAEEEEEGDAAI